MVNALFKIHNFMQMLQHNQAIQGFICCMSVVLFFAVLNLNNGRQNAK